MYKILGADGRQYGPVSADQLRRWIAEGRANAHTQTLLEGTTEWKPLGVLPEFAAHFGAQRPPPISSVSGSHLRRTNDFAMWGMILGILALVCCCFKLIFGALGLVFSLIGLSQINEHPDRYEGRGLAIAGIVLSSLGLIAGVVLLIFALVNGSFHHTHHWNYYQHFGR
jgi:Domain of unknown function (DUF4190)/GYF domain 2